MAKTDLSRVLNVGPMDPFDQSDPSDVSAVNDLTQIGADTIAAKRLLDRHAAMHPRELVTTGGLKRDPARSRALDLDEVEKTAQDVANLPDGSVVESASVHGTGRNRRVLYLYRTPDGRSHRWYFDYDLLDESRKAFARGDGDVREEETQESLQGEVNKLRERIAELEAVGQTQKARPADPPEDEPWSGYADANADDVKDRVADADARQLDAVEKFERGNKDRKGVLDAVEARRRELT